MAAGLISDMNVSLLISWIPIAKPATKRNSTISGLEEDTATSTAATEYPSIE
jgi:hypothetical protein